MQGSAHVFYEAISQAMCNRIKFSSGQEKATGSQITWKSNYLMHNQYS